ncbi:MAG TPA: hypothetical protein VK498_01785, partial [Ferruginibacter sp.]|nr:hypothetical protein [Ferruginibacter sp.]
MRIILTIVILGLYCTSFSQRTCGTIEYTSTYFRTAPVQSVISGPARDTIANEVIFIPVVIHLLYKTSEQNISNEQINSQIEALNKDFS